MPTTITHLELKTFLETYLSSHLGTYTYPGGSMAAIALLPHPTLGFYFPPNDWTVSGIEAVIIRPISSPDNADQRVSGDLAQNYYWKIVLKQHDDGGDLYAAMDDLMVAVSQHYTIARGLGGYVPAAKGGLIPESGTVVIVNPTLSANL